MDPTAVEALEAPSMSDSLSIELIRRKLASEILGRHMYLFGQATPTSEILRRLADAGAQEGTVVLSEDGIDVRLSVLFRPDHPLQAVGALAGLAGRVLDEAMRLERLPAALVVECATTAHGTEWLIVSVDARFGAAPEAAPREIDRNAFAATFLNLLDRSYRGPEDAGEGRWSPAGARVGAPMRVSDLMSRDVTTIGAADSCHEAVAWMVRRKIRHLPVVGPDGTLVGIVTDRDVRHHLFEPRVLKDIGTISVDALLKAVPVREVMSSPVVTVGPRDELEAAARLMLEDNVGSLPVVDNGRVVGIITETDLLRRIVRSCGPECEEIVISFPWRGA